MFFVFGISTKEKDIDFVQTIICPSCNSYGRLEMFMTYTYFSLFFIPIFKWNKKYYVRSTCCDSIYTIDNNLGQAIERGEMTNIKESDLHPININYHKQQVCSNCNYSIDEDFEYCPKCGRKL
ncbi:zinc ribbon domain-containing protein [Tissierella praeacuta]|uniref:zinc ribbon domain-containing protein n=1 Tax=Tissierella praeacuta TaxID=43131 RepID=UPI0028AA5B21|nr:zinc ribbon domain-containing protein [Tissierella praeacuta]